MTIKLIPNKDFYFDDQGLMVLTREYLIKKGHCCQSGCKHCPYDYKNKDNPNTPSELLISSFHEESDVEIYTGVIPEEEN